MDVNKKTENEYFLIDVLDYEKADSFLQALERTADTISIRFLH